MYSNRYIFIYASIMVVVVAAVLSTAASLLKPLQDRNIRTAKMIDILGSAGIDSDKSTAEQLYNKYIIREEAIALNGDIVAVYENQTLEGAVRPFDINLKEEQHKLKLMQSGKGSGEPHFPLFVFQNERQTIYIIPLLGKGLWGPIWGNIALKDDFKTVYGVNFGHKSETPGLGAEIDTKEFQNQFVGKQILDDERTLTSIQVVKGGIGTLPEKNRIHGVDAVSGGTITSNGVTEMLHDCLSNYLEYFNKHYTDGTGI